MKNCLAKTRRGTACQKPPLKGKQRCRFHGGLSTEPLTVDGRARITAAHWKHSRQPKEFVEARAKIWAELRIIEQRMKMDGFIQN